MSSHNPSPSSSKFESLSLRPCDNQTNPQNNLHKEQRVNSTLRSEEEIDADIENSFSTPDKGVAAWDNEMLIQALVKYIENMCLINEEKSASGSSDANTKCLAFFSTSKPPFELYYYIQRLVELSECSSSVFVIMLVYIRRIEEKCKELLVTELNCHRLLCTTLVLAIKYLEDTAYWNTYYASVGCIEGDEMNKLELILLKILDWNLSVDPETFSTYEAGLAKYASLDSCGAKRSRDESFDDIEEQPSKKKRFSLLDTFKTLNLGCISQKSEGLSENTDKNKE